MRPSHSLLILCALLWWPELASASKVKGSPRARFAGGVFFPEEFARKVQGGKFDPFEPAPVSVSFELEGKASIDRGSGEAESCEYKPSAKPGDPLLRATCPGAEPREVRWIWLGPDRAKSDLFGEERVLLRLPHDLAAIQKENQRRFEESARPELAAEYRGSDGTKLVIPARGSATLGGQKRWLRVFECLAAGEPSARTRCVVLALPGRMPVVAPSADDDGIIVLAARGASLFEQRNGRTFTRTATPATSNATR